MKTAYCHGGPRELRTQMRRKVNPRFRQRCGIDSGRDPYTQALP